MTTGIIIWVGLVAVLLAVSLLLWPKHPVHSVFETKRRAKEHTTKTVRRELDRLHHFGRIAALVRIVQLVLLLILAVLLVWWLGWSGGVVAAIGVAIITAIGMVRLHRSAFAAKLYATLEPWLFKAAAAGASYTTWLSYADPDTKLGSKEELIHLIKESPDTLSPSERRRTTHGLAYEDKKVSDIMTVWNDVYTVPMGELLGPLLLDELHKTGERCFPVVGKESTDVAGLLDIKRLVTLNDKRSLTAGKTMSPVYFVHQHDSLDAALQAFVTTEQSLIVVLDDERQPVGVVRMIDVLGAMTGHEFTSRFEAYDDPRAVIRHHHH